MLAPADAFPERWEEEHGEPLLAALATSVDRIEVGAWVPEDTVLDDASLMLSQIEERVIDGVPHLKVVRRPSAVASAFGDDDETDVDEDDDPYEYARAAAERQEREARAAKRRKIIRYGSLGALATVAAGVVFYLSPVGQDLLTNTETVTVEVEKEKTYTGELLGD